MNCSWCGKPCSPESLFCSSQCKSGSRWQPPLRRKKRVYSDRHRTAFARETSVVPRLVQKPLHFYPGKRLIIVPEVSDFDDPQFVSEAIERVRARRHVRDRFV